MRSTLQARQRAEALRLLVTLATSLSADPRPSPTPDHEWMVTPPTLMAAMPVGAVVATCAGAGNAF